MHGVRARLIGLAAIASVGCSIALDFSRANLPVTRDGGAMLDVPALADLPADATDAMDVADVSDAPVGMDAHDVVDATDAPIAMDTADATDVTDVTDVMDVMDVTDVMDVMDAADAADAADATDATDAMDVEDASDVADASLDVPGDRADAGPPCDADLARDPLNCGSCGRRCALTYCNQGVCSICRTGLTQCGLSCYDLLTHGQHCGTCGTRCTGATDTCCAGTCRARCN